MTSIFLQLRKSQNVLNFCSHLFENQLRYSFIVLYLSAQDGRHENNLVNL